MDPTPWYLLPVPAADNTSPCDLGDAPDMHASALAGEGVWMAVGTALFATVLS